MTEELVTGAEIGRRLGVSRQRVQQWADDARFGFPREAVYLPSARVWRWAEVDAWYREYERTRASGRPRKA